MTKVLIQLKVEKSLREKAKRIAEKEGFVNVANLTRYTLIQFLNNFSDQSKKLVQNSTPKVVKKEKINNESFPNHNIIPSETFLPKGNIQQMDRLDSDEN